MCWNAFYLCWCLEPAASGGWIWGSDCRSSDQEEYGQRGKLVDLSKVLRRLVKLASVIRIKPGHISHVPHKDGSCEQLCCQHTGHSSNTITLLCGGQSVMRRSSETLAVQDGLGWGSLVIAKRENNRYDDSWFTRPSMSLA